MLPDIVKIEIFESKDSVTTIAYINSSNNITDYLPYFCTTEPKVSDLEAIYNAKVSATSVKTGLTFVEYSNNKTGILNLDQKINVQSGSYLPVQVTWGGDSIKRPKLSTHIKLIGKYVIILDPLTKSKSPKHKFANQLQDRQRLLPLFDKYQDICLLFRSSIDRLADLNLVYTEITSLLDKLPVNIVQNKIDEITQPTYQFIQLIRELSLSPNITIHTNSQNILDELNKYREIWQLSEVFYDSHYPIKLPELNDFNSLEFRLSFSNCGGINVIDVNTGTSNKHGFFQVNYLSIDEIIKQIYLRDLTGIILIDFIKNMSQLEITKLINKLQELLDRDWRRNQLLGMTKAGICEIIRNK